jgi:Uma2 family endonuclease
MVANRSEHDREFMTFDEYLELDSSNEDVKYEYIDGYAYMMAGGTNNHAALAMRIGRLLGNALEGGPCTVYSSDARVQLAERRRVVHPDVTVGCQEEEIDTLVRYPRVVFEVLSQRTKLYDLSKKLFMYQGCPSIEAVVFIETDFPAINLFQREGKTFWVTADYHGGDSFEIECLGITLSVDEIYRGIRFPPSKSATEYPRDE